MVPDGRIAGSVALPTDSQLTCCGPSQQHTELQDHASETLAWTTDMSVNH